MLPPPKPVKQDAIPSRCPSTIDLVDDNIGITMERSFEDTFLWGARELPPKKELGKEMRMGQNLTSKFDYVSKHVIFCVSKFDLEK